MIMEKYCLDLENPESIKVVYKKAKRLNLFKKAKDIRESFFGKDIHFYGVVYLWDECINYCAYCPGSVPNRKKAISKGRDYQLRKLTVEQAVQETLKVMEDGHTHVCYLSGSAPGRDKLPNKLIPYLKETDKLGLDEIILNIEPLTDKGFRKIRNAIRNTSLQFRVFQETYDKDTYARMHPKGPKADYDFRRQSQARAFRAGFDDVGLGVLFGLHRYPIEELENLKIHADEIEKEFGKKPARICLPSANELENIGVQIPYKLEPGQTRPKKKGEKLGPFKYGDYEKFNELIYVLARLAMPEINIVSSERDTPEMLKILDNYATCTTINTHPGVGDNTNIFGCGTHFEQAAVFPRNIKKTIKEMRKRGFNPLI